MEFPQKHTWVAWLMGLHRQKGSLPPWLMVSLPPTSTFIGCASVVTPELELESAIVWGLWAWYCSGRLRVDITLSVMPSYLSAGCGGFDGWAGNAITVFRDGSWSFNFCNWQKIALSCPTCSCCLAIATAPDGSELCHTKRLVTIEV